MAKAKDPRPLRVCDACGGIDDHPRHSFVTGPDDPRPADPAWVAGVIEHPAMSTQEKADALAVLNDVTWQMRHMDCCRAAGCPDGSCDTLPGLRGSELLAHIQGA